VTPTTSLSEVMALMLDPKVTLLPVVVADEVVGVVTRTDLVRLIEKLESAVESTAD
jgi:CBS domain-containing protein